MNKLEKIKKLLGDSVLFTEEQKTAWLNMLPKMNDGEVDELLAILVDEIKELKNQGINLIDDQKLEAEILGNVAKVQMPPVPKAPVPAPKPNNAFAQELKREVTTPELAKHTEEKVLAGSIPVAKPVNLPKPAAAIPKPAPILEPKAMPAAKPIPKPVMPPVIAPRSITPKPVAPQAPKFESKPMPKVAPTVAPTSGLKSLADIGSVDDLKKIQAAHLRQGKLTDQTNLIRAKITSLAQMNRLLPFDVLASFEQSLLYKSYLAIGANLLMDPNPDRTKAFVAASDKLKSQRLEALNFDEFEAMADLRKQLEQL